MTDNTGIVPPWLRRTPWAHRIIDDYTTTRQHRVIENYAPSLYDDSVWTPDAPHIMQHRMKLAAENNYRQAKQELARTR